MPNFRLILSQKHGKIAMILPDRTHRMLFFAEFCPKKAYHSTPTPLAFGRIFTHAELTAPLLFRNYLKEKRAAESLCIY